MQWTGIYTETIVPKTKTMVATDLSDSLLEVARARIGDHPKVTIQMLSIPFTVRRSIVIDKPTDSVFAVVFDFNTWRNWSPWLSQEPECPVEISGVPGKPGHKQSWDGKKIGSGHMELAEVMPGRMLKYDLFFVKPWRSQSKAAFAFEQEGQATRVSWSMEGTLPIFLFFMKKKMSAMVGSDYDRGLTMLKELLEAES